MGWRRLQAAGGLQALQAVEHNADDWRTQAHELLRQRREIIRIESRDDALNVRDFDESPYRTPVFDRLGRDSSKFDTLSACSTARRVSGPGYSSSYFTLQKNGLGLELMDVCLPMLREGRLIGYTVATYSLQDILTELVGKQLSRGQGVSFTEADGTRLAITGTPANGNRIYKAQQLLDLPGARLVLRMDSWKGSPDFFPNMLTALVSSLALALITVLLMLGRDIRRRLRVEHDLAEALAFRKAMEDSLVTGLRARDLEGRITYVNPAFCKMVGVEAKELLNHNFPSPYWPPELAGVYQDRQAIRLASSNLPQSGFESVFMRRDGTRFPVLIIEAPLINASGKHTGHIGRRGIAFATAFYGEIAIFHVELAGKDVRVRLVADGNENAGHWHGLICTAGGRGQQRAGHTGVIAQHFLQAVIPDDGDFAGLFLLEQMVLQDLLGLQLVAAMHQRDMLGDVGQVQRLFNSRIAAADNHDATMKSLDIVFNNSVDWASTLTQSG